MFQASERTFGPFPLHSFLAGDTFRNPPVKPDLEDRSRSNSKIFAILTQTFHFWVLKQLLYWHKIIGVWYPEPFIHRIWGTWPHQVTKVLVWVFQNIAPGPTLYIAAARF